jgi:hypothetical protein
MASDARHQQQLKSLSVQLEAAKRSFEDVKLEKENLQVCVCVCVMVHMCIMLKLIRAIESSWY